MTLLTANRLMHVLAAVLAVAVARRRSSSGARRSDYDPVAGFLVLTAVFDVARGVAREHGLDLSTAHAHAGWSRVALHLDQAAYLTWPAAVAWLAAAALGGPPMRRTTIGIGMAWVAVLALLVAMYPSMRGVPVDRVIIGSELASTFFSIGAFVSWWRRREEPSLAHGVALLICGIHAAAFAIVARGYTVERWRLAVGSYILLYVVVAFIQGVELWTCSSLESKLPRS